MSSFLPSPAKDNSLREFHWSEADAQFFPGRCKGCVSVLWKTSSLSNSYLRTQTEAPRLAGICLNFSGGDGSQVLGKFSGPELLHPRLGFFLS